MKKNHKKNCPMPFIRKPDISELQRYIDDCEAQVKRAYAKLAEFRKDKEIQTLDKELEHVRSHSLLQLADKEKERLEQFRETHYQKCKNSGTYLYKITGTGIGNAIEVTCPVCSETLDITDEESW